MPVAPPEFLTSIAEPWARYYGHSKIAATIVTFAHVAPLVIGGGTAITLDRASMRMLSSTDDARADHLGDLAAAHRLVLPALGVSLLSGVALLTADLETFWGSWIYWLKMALVGLLVLNGGLMTRIEGTLRGPTADPVLHWRQLRVVAIASLTLWLAVTLAGVALRETA